MCRSSRMPLLCVAMLSAGMVCAVGAVSFEQRLVPVTNYTPTAAAEAAVSALQARYYQPSTGSYGCFPALSQLTALHRDKNGRRRSVSKVETSSTSGPSVGWWNCANAVTALSDFVLAVPNASASATYIKSLESMFVMWRACVCLLFGFLPLPLPTFSSVHAVVRCFLTWPVCACCFSCRHVQPHRSCIRRCPFVGRLKR